MSRPRRIAAAVVLVSTSILLACGTSAPGGVLLVTLDTTRADRLGCYGYDRALTPNLDRLAAEGVLFREAMAPVPVTLPSHASMFTGNYPPVHGIRYNGIFRLNESSVTVAELLRDAGWTTAGIPAAFPVAKRTGIGQGFQRYEDMFEDLELSQLSMHDERKADETSRLGIEFLERAGGGRFFLWLHYYDPHYPYKPPFPFSASHRDRPYDGEIAYVDREIGRVFDLLREAGLWEETLVIVAGDHGEGLYEHNEKMHANLVYESTLRVPLVIKPPGAARPGVVHEPVTLADLAPTILDYAGVEGPAMEGISLLPAVQGDEPPRRLIYFESLAGSLAYGWSPLEGVRDGDWKYIRSPAPELFDLQEDPDETENLYEGYATEAAGLETELAGLEEYWLGTTTDAEMTGIPLDPAELEALAALGYVGGFVTEERREGVDPKQLIHLENDLFTAREELRLQDYELALERLERVLEQDPGNRHGMLMATTAARGAGKLETALEVAGRALELYPEFNPVRVIEGQIHAQSGDYERAAGSFRAGVEQQPDDASLNYQLALSLYALDRVDQAEPIVDRMLETERPEAPVFLVLRAACAAKRGDDGAALEAAREAIAAGYRDRELLEEEPLLEPLRAVPGFAELVRSIPEPGDPASGSQETAGTAGGRETSG